MCAHWAPGIFIYNHPILEEKTTTMNQNNEQEIMYSGKTKRKDDGYDTVKGV